MNNIKKEIIELIQKNKISTTEVADALNKTGVLEDFYPVNEKHFVVGEVKYVYTYNESNWALHEQIQNVEEDVVIFVDSINCEKRALFGDLVTKYLILYKKVKGIVVNGKLRDGARLKRMNYPIWCKGITPLGCFNNYVEISEEQKIFFEQRKKIFEGSIMVCDDGGCVIIEKDKINYELYKKLEFIEVQEDIWYFCVDTLKWSTFDTVCKKKYLDEDVLPPVLKNNFKKFL